MTNDDIENSNTNNSSGDSIDQFSGESEYDFSTNENFLESDLQKINSEKKTKVSCAPTY